MNQVTGFLAVVLMSLGLCLAIASTSLATTLADIEPEVMCVECGTPLNVSTSAVAERERAFIRRQIAAGKGKSEIKQALTNEFGPAVLALPQAQGFNWFAYLGPIGAVAMACGAVVMILRRGRRAAAMRREGSLSLRERQRLEDEIRGFDGQL